jgi:hypothetical protein
VSAFTKPGVVSSVGPIGAYAEDVKANDLQFIEHSDLSLRSAVYRLSHPKEPLQFLLFPMIHIAAPAFYAAVRERLEGCDTIFTEGVASRSVWLLTRSYRIVEHVRGSGLVSQRALDLRSLKAELINADVSAEDFEEGWHRVPLSQRLLLFAGLPLVTTAMCFRGPKAMFGEYLALDDLPSRREILNEGFDQAEDILTTRRDVALLNHLAAFHEQHHADSSVAGVLWGAQHARRAIQFLMGSLGYRVASAEWLTVFEY